VVLTTHGMEEAERVCDRLGVLIAGRLRCVGSPAQLLTRFGGSLVLTLSVPPDPSTPPLAGDGGVPDDSDARRAAEVVAALYPPAGATGGERAAGGAWRFELPRGAVGLPAVFRVMGAARAAGKVAEWGVASTSLEEVFIRLAQQSA
jgi:ABC-type multidrug transport system ATPase subunit